MTPRRIGLFVANAVLVLGADLLTKWWTFQAIGEGSKATVIRGVFYLSPSCNTGGVFGALTGRVLLFIVLSLVAVAFILWVFWRQGAQDRWLTVGLGVLLGGAAGNLYDRVLLQKVRDFLDFRIAGWPWPTFNVADTAICVGVGLLFLSSLLPAGSRVEAQRAQPPSE